MHVQELQAEVVHLRQELAAAQQLAGAASGTWEHLRKERDFHRLHHKRVAQVGPGAAWVHAAVELKPLRHQLRSCWRRQQQAPTTPSPGGWTQKCQECCNGCCKASG
jgi:hypothetical protein